MAKAGSNRPAKRTPHSNGARAKTAIKAGGNHRGRAAAALPLRFTIRSDFHEGHEVQKRILDDVERAGFNSTSTFAIKLALEEALINAIKHGNKLDPSKQVTIEARVTPAETEIIIEDEGKGFQRTCVPDPTLEENLEKCSGRGILLMEAYMNRVEWTNGGRRVRMLKKNEADAVAR
jgi:serine/threonine-protein kinase RsbW